MIWLPRGSEGTEGLRTIEMVPGLDALPQTYIAEGWPWAAEIAPIPDKMPDGQSWPKVSIVTPSFNQGAFLEQTIRSVLLQGYPNLEYIIMDGGSRDGSLEILEKYDRWLSYWASEPDRGQSHAINKGWSRAGGEILAYLNSDDFYFPGALRTMVEAWARNPSIGLVAGGVAFTDAHGRIRSSRQAYLKDGSPGDLSLLLPEDWFLPQQAAFFPTKMLDKAGRWLREDLHFTMDRELFYRLSRYGEIHLVDQTLAGDRSHPYTKRTQYTLAMYREDKKALAYCTWGGVEDFHRRLQVARWRGGQGHIHLAKRSTSRLDSIKHLLLAAVKQPLFLRRRAYQKEFLRTLGMWEVVNGFRLALISKIR
ncbi:MAG: glycosyltransferase family 2 protein [Anaerolineales bacterium]|nr:glycosyltransferase family 2 protein [Anaerolineales bacterium]